MTKTPASLHISLLILIISLPTASTFGQTQAAAPVLKAEGSSTVAIRYEPDNPAPAIRPSSAATMPMACSPITPTQVTITECSSMLPLLSATDGTAISATSYLTTIQAVNGIDGNTPLQIVNQANSTGGALFPTPIAGGYGGIDLIQSAVATKVGTVVTNYSSPTLQLCAQEMVGSGPTSGPDCWQLQVQGGSGSNSNDVIQWSQVTNNTTHDITMLWPAQINLAAAGQITVGPNVDATIGDVSGILSTFTGQKTSVATPTVAKAGPVTIEPGQLTASSVGTGSQEGALQILQGYMAGTNTNLGRLACPSGTQSAAVCTAFGPAENWVGVFNGINGSQGVTVTPLRYGRVGISSSAPSLVFNSGDFVCKDDTNSDIHGTGFVIDNGSTPCPIGESIGVAVGDPSPVLPFHEHLVDLVASASVSGATAQGQILHFNCSQQVASNSTTYLNGAQCSTSTMSDSVEFSLPYASTGTYTFSRMYVNYGVAGVTGDTVKLYVNGTMTNISCPPTSTTPLQCSDLTDTASIIGGQTYSIRVATGTADLLKNINVTIQLQ